MCKNDMLWFQCLCICYSQKQSGALRLTEKAPRSHYSRPRNSLARNHLYNFNVVFLF